jgi:hypothetical protein
MAPEVMCALNHTIAVDYFALGVFGYEFMLGKVKSTYIILETIFRKVKKRDQRTNYEQTSSY